MRLKPQPLQCVLEHEPMRLVGPYRFGDEDELHRQRDVPRREVLLIGIGHDGGAYGSERVQHRERFGVELHFRRHLEEENP